MNVSGHKIRSNLILQYCLHFNLYLFPLWCWIEFANVSIKRSNTILTVDQDSQVYNFLHFASFLLILVVEIVRLYVGYVGNQLEKVQQMLAFTFLSTFLQLPNHLFRLMAILDWNWHSIHRITSCIIALALLCIEICSNIRLYIHNYTVLEKTMGITGNFR
ncbi:Transmembrane protein 17, partial [Blomia tropicalis]